MLIKTARKRGISLEQPLLHSDHARPKTRREFISQGFMAGAATVSGASLFSLLASPRKAEALSQALEDRKEPCGIRSASGEKVPFICFDLAGGANIAGSNVLMGKSGGQMDFLSTAGYIKLGLAGTMVPNLGDQFINNEFGLAFHADSGFLRGLQDTVSVGARANINGSIIAARSENDTGNNPHNPMYGILKAGADGELLSLIGSQSSESGGNSMAPMNLINPQARPTKVDRPTDVTGLVDVGDLTSILSQPDAVAVMESIRQISRSKLDNVDTTVTSRDMAIKDQVDCGYVKSADLTERFGNPDDLDPARDTDIVGAGGIFTDAEFNDGNRESREFRKTASVMKLVQNGYAGAGTVTLGGYDYHTGERSTGESRDYLAGRCMGACLEYAHRTQTKLMLYVFSDGSVSSNGRIDDSEGGRGKGEWTGDNQQTAASFYLVYNPNGQIVVRNQQIGWMRSDASVETASSPAANNVNQLVQTVILNYMALNGEENRFEEVVPGHGLGNSTSRDRLVGIEPLS